LQHKTKQHKTKKHKVPCGKQTTLYNKGVWDSLIPMIILFCVDSRIVVYPSRKLGPVMLFYFPYYFLRFFSFSLFTSWVIKLAISDIAHTGFLLDVSKENISPIG
jgi:hypothetical protein